MRGQNEEIEFLALFSFTITNYNQTGEEVKSGYFWEELLSKLMILAHSLVTAHMSVFQCGKNQPYFQLRH